MHDATARLRTLLLADISQVSTQEPLTRALKAAPKAVTMASALSFWMVWVALAAAWAWAHGAAPGFLAEASALAVAPALASLMLLPSCNQNLPGVVSVGAWVVAAMGLVAGGGGALSPLVAVFAVAPAIALALGRGQRSLVLTGVASAAAYVIACSVAFLEARPSALLGPFPEFLSAGALLLAAGLVTLGVGARRRPVSEPSLARRVAEVSHELRTPLTHIIGFAELIEKQLFGPLGERYVEYAGLIRRSGSQLLELVNDQLEVSRIEAGRYQLDLETFDARAIVEEVVRVSADAAARKSIALSAWTPPVALNVRADAAALRRMLTNTVGNAIKFTPEGGRVILAARGAGDVVVLETLDNGPGIPADERDLLGEAFERGAGGALASGTGLGLSLVRALAELHGGRLSFHDAPGGGALVRIDLPVLVLANSAQ